MNLIPFDRDPAPAKLKSFGAVAGLMLALLGLILRWRFGAAEAGMALWVAAGVLVLVYYVAPRVQRPLYLGWMYASYPLGLALSYVVLALAYFLIIAPLGLVLRRDD